jgi:Folate receptor family
MTTVRSFFLGSLLLLSLSLSASGETCPRTDESSQSGNDVGECTWYSEDSCCNFQNTLEAGVVQYTEDVGCGKETLTKGCAEMRQTLLCGQFCSPEQGKFTSPNTNKMSICESFANGFYDACKKSEMPVGENRECSQLEDEYDNGPAYFNDQPGYRVTSDLDECFNSGARTTIAFATLFVAAAAALAL